MSGAGTRLITRGIAQQERERHDGDHELRQARRGAGAPEGGHLAGVRIGERADGQARGVLDLKRRDDRGDPGRETRRDRVRDVLDQPAEPREPHRDQKKAGHEAGREQACQAMLGDDRREDDHEGRRRTGHLELATAQQRDHRPRDDRRVEPLLGRRAHGDSERHRQRQGDDADDHAGEDVGTDLARSVSVGERPPQRGTYWQTTWRGLKGCRRVHCDAPKVSAWEAPVRTGTRAPRGSA